MDLGNASPLCTLSWLPNNHNRGISWELWENRSFKRMPCKFGLLCCVPTPVPPAVSGGEAVRRSFMPFLCFLTAADLTQQRGWKFAMDDPKLFSARFAVSI